MRTPMFQITANLLGLTLATPSFATDYFVGAGAGCTHSSIQSAINSAAGRMGLDRIRIAANRI